MLSTNESVDVFLSKCKIYDIEIFCAFILLKIVYVLKNTGMHDDKWSLSILFVKKIRTCVGVCVSLYLDFSNHCTFYYVNIFVHSSS